jgi:hypothetical protein
MRRSLPVLFLVVPLVSLALAANTFAAPGDRDESFGKFGVVTSYDTPAPTSPDELAIDPLGRVYVGGHTRFLPNGQPDETYGPAGTRPSQQPDGSSVSWNLVKIAPTGNAVIGCSLTLQVPGGTDPRYCVWIGDVADPTGTTGRLVQLDPSAGGAPTDLAVAPNGSIAMLTKFPARRFWMLTPSGDLDPRFPIDAGRTLGKSRGREQIAFDSQGRLLLLSRRWVARLTLSGALDRTFGKHGRVRGRWDAITVDAAGRILLGTTGRFRPRRKGSRHKVLGVVVTRLRQNGKADRRFGVRGVAGIKPEGNYGAAVRDLVAPDNRIYVGLEVTYDSDGDYSSEILTLTDTGRVDKGFGEKGFVHGDSPSLPVAGLAVGAPDRILMGGFNQSGASGVWMQAFKLH